MSLTPIGSGLTLTSCSPQDACPNEGNNTIILVESALPSWRVVNPVTLVQSLSATCLSSPVGTTLITPLSSVVISSFLNTVDFIEISTGYKTNISGGSAAASLRKGQVIAGDQGLGIALAASNTANTLVKITSGGTASTITFAGIGNDTIRTVVWKSTNVWFLGTQGGYIYQVDQFGSIQDVMLVPLLNTTNKNAITLSSYTTNPIYNISIDNNLLLVGTDTVLYIIDWSTKTIVGTYAPPSSSTNSPVLFCTSSSGETIVSRASFGGGTGIFYEYDFTVSPGTVRDHCFLNSSQGVVVTGINNGLSIGWSFDSSGNFRSATISARPSLTRTVTVQASGVNVLAEYMVINDTAGVGGSFISLDTYMRSPSTYRMPSGGYTLMETIKYGDGSVAQWDCSRFNT